MWSLNVSPWSTALLLSAGTEFTVRAKTVLNAVGPYADWIRKLDKVSSISSRHQQGV